MSLKSIFHNGEEVRAGWRLLIFCALVAALAFGAIQAFNRLPMPEYHGLHPLDLITNDAVLLVVALVATGIMARFEHRKFATYGIPRLRVLFGPLFWKGAVWGFAMPTVIILLIYFSGGYKLQGLNLTGSALFKFFWAWLLANLMIGLTEEILFRGYFMYTLSAGIGFCAAAIIESVFFGALHYFTKPFERWEDWLAVSLLTVFITLALRRTGSLAFPIGMHAAFDFAFLYVFSGMNGGAFGVGRLLNAEFPGSIRITGGRLGPEASWFTFLVTSVAIVLLHFMYHEAKWPRFEQKPAASV